MKRRFKYFLKALGESKIKKITLKDLTILFNKWATQSVAYGTSDLSEIAKKAKQRKGSIGSMANLTKACISKHVMRKWVNRFEMPVIVNA